MTQKHKLIIATRESPLALWQANWVKAQLELLHPNLAVALLGITTQADKTLEIPLYKIGGKGLFVKELEEALLTKRADLAVHSMKDVPMILPPGLVVPVMCEREDPRDAFVSASYATLADLPKGAIVGTSSLRRQSQILWQRPDLNTAFLRGNVNTRLNKLDHGEYAAIILAAAGLKRLNLADRIRSYLTVEQILPAAAQGVLGIECRADDELTQSLIAPLNDPISYACASAERAMCRHLGGGCHVPIAAYAKHANNHLTLNGLVANPNGTQILRTSHTDTLNNPEAIGLRAADDLLAQGAQALLAV